MRVIFFGSGNLACTVLSTLFEDHTVQVLAVVTQPDKPAGRGNKITAPPMKRLARAHRIPVLQYRCLDSEARETLRTFKADVFVVAEYGLLIPLDLLAVPQHGALNVHPSLLPHCRGASPIASAILEGATETGVTIILLDEKMDHGPIVAQSRTALADDDSAPTLEANLGRLGGNLLIAKLEAWIHGEITPRAQEHARATFCKKITREDGHVSWGESSELIYRKYRAFLPWPGLFSWWNGVRVKWLAVAPENQNYAAAPGTVVRHDGGLYVTCGQGALKIVELQMAGKPPVTADSFLKGHSDIIGTLLT